MAFQRPFRESFISVPFRTGRSPAAAPFGGRHAVIKKSLPVLSPDRDFFIQWYHRLTRANTPDSASFRRFLPFSPCWASAQRRLKNQKSLENTSLPGAGSFIGAEMCPDKERPAENTAVLSRDLTRYGRISARQNRVCPCQSMVVSPLYLISRGKATGKNRELFLCVPPLFVGFAGA